MDQIFSVGAPGRVMVQVEDGSPNAIEAMAGVGAEEDYGGIFYGLVIGFRRVG